MLTAYADFRVLTVTALLIQGMFRNSVQANVISLSFVFYIIHDVFCLTTKYIMYVILVNYITKYIKTIKVLQ